MKEKEIVVAFYRPRFTRGDWQYTMDTDALEHFFDGLHRELDPMGIRVSHLQDDSMTLDVRGYGDLLNCVRIRSLQDNISNLCLGHIIGTSKNCDLLEDIRRGVSRVAFAPETIEPEGSNKIVCHNCGCGC